jgi:soluble lytic murein transglycosylase-like protein
MYRWSLLVCSLFFAFSNDVRAQELETISAGSVFVNLDLESFRPADDTSELRAAEVLPKQYAEMILELSAKHEVSWQLVGSIIRAESNFKCHATSSRGARGLMQLSPRTASRYQVSAKELYDPYKNIEAGIKHLKWLIARYSGDLKMALAAYNTGEFTVDRYRGIPPFRTTRFFVRKILQESGL